jgi:hypothetical protein
LVYYFVDTGVTEPHFVFSIIQPHICFGHGSCLDKHLITTFDFLLVLRSEALVFRLGDIKAIEVGTIELINTPITE